MELRPASLGWYVAASTQVMVMA